MIEIKSGFNLNFQQFGLNRCINSTLYTQTCRFREFNINFHLLLGIVLNFRINTLALVCCFLPCAWNYLACILCWLSWSGGIGQVLAVRCSWCCWILIRLFSRGFFLGLWLGFFFRFFGFLFLCWKFQRKLYFCRLKSST